MVTIVLLEATGCFVFSLLTFCLVCIHSTFSKAIFGLKPIPVLEHPLYLYDLYPYDFFTLLKGLYFVSLSDIQSNVTITFGKWFSAIFPSMTKMLECVYTFRWHGF
jgi:hypothetical protein